MDQIKLAADLSTDEAQQQESLSLAKANELRTLSDLEMVLAGGGDGAVCW